MKKEMSKKIFNKIILLICSLLIISLVNLDFGFSEESENNEEDFKIKKSFAMQIGFSGNNNAEFPPCQCKYDPYGGLARLFTLVKDSRRKNKDIIWVNLGNFFSPEATKEKHNLVKQVLSEMKLDFIVPGAQDFLHGYEYLFEGDYNLPLICSNAEYSKTFDKKNSFMKTQIRKLNGLKIAFIALENSDHFFEEDFETLLPDIKFTDPKSFIKDRIEKTKKRS